MKYDLQIQIGNFDSTLVAVDAMSKKGQKCLGDFCGYVAGCAPIGMRIKEERLDRFVDAAIGAGLRINFIRSGEAA